MSFGFSPSDIWTLITVTKRAYDGWRSAGKRFEDITDTLHSFQILLKHIHHRYNEVETTAGLQDRRADFDQVLRGCTRAVTQLADVVRKHEKLRTWDRLRLGLQDITEPKESLVRHMGLLTPFLLITEMESIGKDIRSVPKTFDEIPAIIQSAVTVAFGNMLDARADENGLDRSSVLTTYGDDDKAAYKELRRGLHSLGIEDSAVREHRSELLMLMRSVLSPQAPPRATCDRTRFPHSTSNFLTPSGGALSDFQTLNRDVSYRSKDHNLEHGKWHSSSTAHQVHVERINELGDLRNGNDNGPVDGPLVESSRSGIDTFRTDRDDGVGSLQSFRAFGFRGRIDLPRYFQRLGLSQHVARLVRSSHVSGRERLWWLSHGFWSQLTRTMFKRSRLKLRLDPSERANLPPLVIVARTNSERECDTQSELCNLPASDQADSTFFDDASSNGSLQPEVGGRLPYIPPSPFVHNAFEDHRPKTQGSTGNAAEEESEKEVKTQTQMSFPCIDASNTSHWM